MLRIGQEVVILCGVGRFNNNNTGNKGIIHGSYEKYNSGTKNLKGKVIRVIKGRSLIEIFNTRGNPTALKAEGITDSTNLRLWYHNGDLKQGKRAKMSLINTDR